MNEFRTDDPIRDAAIRIGVPPERFLDCSRSCAEGYVARGMGKISQGELEEHIGRACDALLSDAPMPRRPRGANRTALVRTVFATLVDRRPLGVRTAALTPNPPNALDA